LGLDADLIFWSQPGLGASPHLRKAQTPPEVKGQLKRGAVRAQATNLARSASIYPYFIQLLCSFRIL
jgi:hypothetical protein